jgi:hypothetical protein
MRRLLKPFLSRLPSEMLEAVPLLGVTLVFIGIFIYSYATLQLEEIRANWNERRCDPLVMMMAQMVPDGKDPTIDPSEFATDNFGFCIGRLIDSSISIFMQPMLKLFSAQVDATKPINESMGYLRGMASSLLAPLYGLFNKLWEKFGYIVYQVARIFFKLHSAMDRIFGIALASLFAGMSMYKAIQNSIGFVLQVIIAILIILCILVVFLFFVMWPVIPIILTMIGILSTSVYAANVSGMSGSFCVGPDTLVKVAEGGWKKVSEIEAGDLLGDGQKVEGVLKVACGDSGTCVSIRGVIISKTHLVLCDGRWIPAEDHGDAIVADAAAAAVDFLYCLNTSNRMWEVKAATSQDSEEAAAPLVLRDWEELPDDHEEIDFAWDTLIFRLLNGADADIKPLRQAPGRGLLGKDTYVWKDRVGTIIPITQVRPGDMISDGKGFTKVIGTYRDTSPMNAVPLAGPNESIWYYMPIKKQWNHPDVKCQPRSNQGYQLVTESGTYMVGFTAANKTGRLLIRDFTEVGAKRIHETYPFTQSFLNNL